MVCAEEMGQVMVHRTGVGLGSVTLNKVLLVDRGLFRSWNQKGEHFKSFRDGPPGVKWFLGWMLLAEIVSTWLLANHFCVCKVLVPV